MASTAVQEIERAIGTLSADDLRDLCAWFEQNRPDPFEEQIAADFSAGRLDRAVQEALSDAENGQLRAL